MTQGPIRNLDYTRLEIRGTDYLVGTTSTGPALLLLHGFPQTHYCWRALIPGLAAGRTVVVADLRGYGGSHAEPGGPRGGGLASAKWPRSS